MYFVKSKKIQLDGSSRFLLFLDPTRNKHFSEIAEKLSLVLVEKR